MPEIYVRGKRIRLSPSMAIGKGGEADIYDIGGGKALKVFKPPTHSDLENDALGQQAARIRLDEHQRKLPAFPRNLPPRVIAPQNIATNRSGKRIVGYTMKYLRDAEVLLRYADRGFRQAGIPNEDIIRIFLEMHATVAATHRAGVVIGDFNDLNVMVLGTEAHLIDADSFQFNPFVCRTFTARFVDPLICDPRGKRLEMTSPHNADSDWYSFAIMLMQCLLFVGPYGGVYRPKEKRKRIPHDHRPLKRITVFNPEVRYPRPAVPYGVLPDDLLQQFHLTFEHDRRGEFPRNLIESLRWTTCAVCNTEHARAKCPTCETIAPAAIKQVVRIRGKVTSTRIFRTHGIILFADIQRGKLRFLYHKNGQFKREDESTVLHGALDPHMRYRLRGDATLMGKRGQLIVLQPETAPERISVDTYGNLPIFDANGRHTYWTTAGQLFRDGQFGQEYIGDVLERQTLFWVGPEFGFGFYRAGNIQVAFVFNAERRGINDSVKLPPFTGQLIDSACLFTSSRCWFFVSTREGGQNINRCFVVKADGSVEAVAETQADDGSWLGTLRGKCAAGNFLLAATDDGIIRVEPSSGQIVKTREFPDTEPFVHAGCHLFVGKNGLYVVDRQEIRLLKIA